MSSTWDSMKAGENALIPPDEPDNYIVDVERAGGVSRYVYKDGTTDWKIDGLMHDCVQQDAMEAAYALGMAAMEAQNKRLRELAYSRGVLDTAQTCLCPARFTEDGENREERANGND